MKPLYKHCHEGIWFSRNGHRAYLRGEKPKRLWIGKETIQPTEAHHIELRDGLYCRRNLVMFFRRLDVGPAEVGGAVKDPSETEGNFRTIRQASPTNSPTL